MCLPLVATVVREFGGTSASEFAAAAREDARAGATTPANASKILRVRRMIALSFVDSEQMWDLCARGPERWRFCILILRTSRFLDIQALHAAHELVVLHNRRCGRSRSLMCVQLQHAVGRFCAYTTPFAVRDGPSEPVWAATCGAYLWELELDPLPVAVNFAQCRDGRFAQHLFTLTRARSLPREVGKLVECVSSTLKHLSVAGRAFLTGALAILMDFPTYAASRLPGLAKSLLRTARGAFPTCDMGVASGVKGQMLPIYGRALSRLQECFPFVEKVKQMVIAPIGSWKRSDLVRRAAAITEILPTFTKMLLHVGTLVDPGMLRWLCSTQRPGVCLTLLSSNTLRLTPPLAHFAISTLMLAFPSWCRSGEGHSPRLTLLCFRLVEEVSRRCQENHFFAEAYRSDCLKWMEAIAPDPHPSFNLRAVFEEGT